MRTLCVMLQRERINLYSSPGDVSPLSSPLQRTIHPPFPHPFRGRFIPFSYFQQFFSLYPTCSISFYLFYNILFSFFLFFYLFLHFFYLFLIFLSFPIFFYLFLYFFYLFLYFFYLFLSFSIFFYLFHLFLSFSINYI